MALTQGFFKPKNPQKYNGDPTNIVYRSGWELKFMLYLDGHRDVVKWSSEEIVIPYKSPVDGRWHRYFPDFLIVAKNKEGLMETTLIEIKPAAQTVEPARKTKKTKRYINEVFTWGINSSKWSAAQKYCDERGWKFKILTEKELGIK